MFKEKKTVISPNILHAVIRGVRIPARPNGTGKSP
jgi:hypothetical protein